MKEHIVYPYMPSSVKSTKEEMLNYLGVKTVEQLITKIPQDLRLKGNLDIPEALLSEIELKDHVEELLNKNTSTADVISFLGAGAYRHYVPAICDEINSRSEFLTAYCGETYTDHGKCQAIFEFTSLMSELVDMDVTGLATYDGAQAACTAISMGMRITNRNKVLVPYYMSPEILSQFKNFADHGEIERVKTDPITGQMDIEDLKLKLDKNTATVFIENPNYLGVFEAKAKEIGELAHEKGALFVVSIDPMTMGVVEAPVNYGADVVCGDIQCFGIHMGFGSGQSGFISANSKPELIMNFPNHFYSLYENSKGEFGYARSIVSRTSYGSREEAVEYLGTNTGLWAITVAVYLSLMGPKGLEEVCENIIQKCDYAKKQISTVEMLKLGFNSSNFKEFTVDFSGTKKTVKEINKALLAKGIFGGKDLSKDFPELGQMALYCVTELTTKKQIDVLVLELKNILS